VIRVRYLRSFDASLAGLSSQDQAGVRDAVCRLLDYFSGKSRSQGLGLRKLTRDWWEIRASIDKRILFLLEGGIATFVIVGNHDEIRRCLRRG